MNKYIIDNLKLTIYDNYLQKEIILNINHYIDIKKDNVYYYLIITNNLLQDYVINYIDNNIIYNQQVIYLYFNQVNLYLYPIDIIFQHTITFQINKETIYQLSKHDIHFLYLYQEQEHMNLYKKIDTLELYNNIYGIILLFFIFKSLLS